MDWYTIIVSQIYSTQKFGFFSRLGDCETVGLYWFSYGWFVKAYEDYKLVSAIHVSKVREATFFIKR